MAPFVSSLYALLDSSERCHLHSRRYLLFTRAFAALLVVALYRVFISDVAALAHKGVLRAIVETVVHASLLGALIVLLWLRLRPIMATRRGLEIGSGKRLRMVPWDRVVDIREMPWIRFSPPWYPKMYQVDLEGGEAFDFIGVCNAREIVIEFVQRDADLERERQTG